MAMKFDALVRKVLAWSNRDLEVFNVTDPGAGNFTLDNAGVLGDFMQYAADKAYRVLRVPPMEKTFRITPTDAMIEGNCLPVPADLIEFIHIRIVDAFGTGNSIVLNNKADTRTFHDYYGEKYDVNYTWTRQGNQVLLPANPGVQANCVYEIFYYGRLGRLDAAYDVTAYNSNLDTFIGDSPNRRGAYLTETADDTETALYEVDGVFFDSQQASEVATYWTANEAQNWLRDENERIVLFGSLSEAFSYLGEDDMMQKYEAKFGEEITTLNREEEMRHASGGNVQVNFNGRGLI